jgi:hypothetical protein
LLQAAVDQGFVTTAEGKQSPCARALRAWLKHYGIGIDCSALVQHILTRLIKVGSLGITVAKGIRGGALRVEHAKHPHISCPSRIFTETQKVCCAKAKANLEKYQDYEIGWMRTGPVYRELNNDPPNSKLFERIETPAAARPGDILVKEGHIRLIVRPITTDDKNIVFELAESTSAWDFPKGQRTGEKDIGPRLIQVQYPKPNSPIRQQSPRQLGPKERFTPDSDECSYILGRLKTR